MGFLTGPLDVGLSALFENKPDVPDFHWTDLLQQQLNTAQGNLDVLPQAEQLGTRTNDFLRSERAKTLSGIPGLGDIEGQTASNIKSWLRGELSPDVTSQVNRATNARAFEGGYQGSGMGRNLNARDLGLTSQGLQTQGVGAGETYAANEAAMRRIPEFNPASMFLDPYQSAKFNADQSAAAWNRDWLSNRVQAQPEPWQSALMSDVNGLDAYLGTTGAAAGGQYAGSMARGGGSPVDSGGVAADYANAYESGADLSQFAKGGGGDGSY